jgi:hypothetical protein
MVEELAGQINCHRDFGLDASPETFHNTFKVRELDAL